MIKPTITLLLLLFLAPAQQLFSQKIKFGKVSKEELEEKFYPLDSSVHAAILYKKRRTYYNYTGSEGWVLITKVHERIKIYNKEGYKWATKNIRLYKGNDDETASIKAYTFNLVNDKIEKIKLKNDEIYREDINKYWGSKKFTMPNLMDGSVLDWEYTITSPYHHNINDMVFQYDIPVKYIDTKISIPEYFKFKYLPSYYYPVKIDQVQKSRKLNFSYRTKDDDRIGGRVKTSSQNTSVDLNEIVYSSIEKNIPALKIEPYVNNIENYRSKTSFEYMAYTPRNGAHKYYNTTWEDVTKTIYQNSNFGNQLKKSSYFTDDLNSIVNMTDPVSEKIAKTFELVKSKIKYNGYRNKYTTDGVKKAYKDGVGNVAEINLTLVAMLREAGLTANPVLVSTRDNGIPLFPTSEGFNYVIACVEIQSNLILLDATEKYSLPNVLPLRDLNWQGRIVRKDGSSSSIDLFPKKLSSERIFVNTKLDSEGLGIGSYRAAYSNLSALNHRNKYNEVIEQDLIGILEKENQNIEISKLKVSNEDDISKPLIYTLEFETEDQAEIIGDKIYFSPLLFLTEKENPFKLEDRKYPVDFGSPWEEKYNINIEIPEGYIIESKPENAAYALPNKLGSYKFMTAIKNNKLQVQSIIHVNTPIIASIYYKSLKEFYKLIIDKQLEKVVLTKQ